MLANHCTLIALIPSRLFRDWTTSGFVCNFDDHVTGNLVLKNEFEAFGRHIPSLDHPFFALLDKNHRHETQGGFA